MVINGSKTTVSLYLELLKRNLKDSKYNVLDNTLKVWILVELVFVMNFIHKNELIHRDLKIENIFCLELIDRCTNYHPTDPPSFETILEDIRIHSYNLAPRINEVIINRLDRELSSYESSHQSITTLIFTYIYIFKR